MMNKKDCDAIYEELSRLKFSDTNSWNDLILYIKLVQDIVEENKLENYNVDLDMNISLSTLEQRSNEHFDIIQESLKSNLMDIQRKLPH